ncbi:hypothetical protein DVH24_011807 [Malus domestica]|uniref:X8 domain-containing protein n=1 Tax=Malus domestica TaxID=3750 RepID=A0A498K188_MALDO|nr:hypothetical protein DVH24_011807 [Malus domestica]
MKPSSRYSSYDARSSTSSHFSDPSSSTELKLPVSSRAVVKSKPSDPNISTMVKKFMEKRSTSKAKPINPTGLVIPSDLIAGGLKKPAKNGSGSNFAALGRKLFGKGAGTTSSDKKKEVKALTEVKGNTRTLAMVLRSERELLNLNKEQEVEIVELKLMIQEKNREVDKLKDLCLKQREEIKSLKSAILFPDVMNSQLQELLEKQGSELKQAKQVIPNLQRQVCSLTGQLQCLAEDLAEVKADKGSVGACLRRDDTSPRTPTYDDKEYSNSLEFSSGEPASPGSPDDMFLKDLNPCLTPFPKTKSKEFDEMGYNSPYRHDESLSENNMEFGFNSCSRKLSRSSDCCQKTATESRIAQGNRRSDGMRLPVGKCRKSFNRSGIGTAWLIKKSSRWSIDIGDADNSESLGIKKVNVRYLLVIISSNLIYCEMKLGGQLDQEWCIADEQTPDEELQMAMKWACEAGGADCSKIQENQECFWPNTTQHHASYAFNNYYQRFKQQGATCYFNSAALVTALDPSDNSCKFEYLP